MKLSKNSKNGVEFLKNVYLSDPFSAREAAPRKISTTAKTEKIHCSVSRALGRVLSPATRQEMHGRHHNDRAGARASPSVSVYGEKELYKREALLYKCMTSTESKHCTSKDASV